MRQTISKFKWIVGMCCFAVSGCSIGEATADGIFAGVSNTIAGVISGVLLDLLGVST